MTDVHKIVVAEQNADADESDFVCPKEYTEDGISDKLSKACLGELKYIPERGWVNWDGKRFKFIDSVLVMQKARLRCREAASDAINDLKLEPSKREKIARDVSSAKTAAAVEKLARGDSRHYSEMNQWDTHKYLLNTPGGTVDLKTGKIREHSKKDKLTKVTRATPRGDAPIFDSVLNKITGNNLELKSYFKRLFGYAIVGDPCEEMLAFFYGHGGNGKGTLISAVTFPLGYDYACTAGMETFTQGNFDRHPTDLANLAGKRLVTAQETEEGRAWNESRIKAMTGRDKISARFMRKDFFEFDPEMTIIVAGNNKPSLKATDEAIRRRLHLVPFTVQLSKEERDPLLKDKLKAEADGILNWMVEGALEWQLFGLNPPKVIVDATNEYFEDEDTFKQWLEEHCLFGSSCEILTNDLFKSFRKWKEDRGEGVLSQKKFTQNLKDRGFEYFRNRNGSNFRGIQLLPQRDSDFHRGQSEARNGYARDL